MRENVILEIIAKVLSDEATSEEKEKLELWLAEGEENRKKFNTLKKVWETPNSQYTSGEIINHEHIKEKVWNKSVEGSNRISASSVDIGFFVKVAASIAIIVTSIWGTWSFINSYPKVELAQMVVKENPSGQKSKIYLPDGSTVWLNSSSKLSFYPEFTDTLRHLVLKGEAYFQVAKDAKRPFIVEASDISVKALGTEFNVKAYDLQDPNVSLLEGKVEVSVRHTNIGNILHPGEFSSYSSENKDLTKGNFDPIKATGWKDGILYFENAQLPEIIEELELWYGVDIQNQITVSKTKHFNGQFDNESLENVLDNISFALEFDYEINGNHVIIK